MFAWSRRLIGWTVITAVVVGGIGLLGFGTSFGSYVRSSLGMMKDSVKDSIPIEFEIQRARDLLEELIPEMRANLRIVAAEEVEVANLESEIEHDRRSVEAERNRIRKLRQALTTHRTSYRVGGRSYDRGELVDLLAARFDRLTMAERFLAGKEDLLRNRKGSLSAAMRKLEKTRLARIELESQIESLEEQFRLMQLKASGRDFGLDETRLSQVQKVIAELKKRLDVTEKVMAREAKFIDVIPDDMPGEDEEAVVGRVDAYFGGRSTPTAARTSEY